MPLEAPYGYYRDRVHAPELDRPVDIYVHPSPAPDGFRLVTTGDWKP